MSQATLFCRQCGKPVPADARFCRSCGAPQSGVAMPDSEAVVPDPAHAVRQPQGITTASTSKRGEASVQERRRGIVAGSVAAGALLLVLVGKALFASPSPKANTKTVEVERLRPVLASPSTTQKRDTDFDITVGNYTGTWKADGGESLFVALGPRGSPSTVTLDGNAGQLDLWGQELRGTKLFSNAAVLSVGGRTYAAETTDYGNAPILYLWDGARLRVFHKG